MIPFSAQTRRAFLGRTSQGLGAVALASLLKRREPLRAASQGVVPSLPCPQKAKRVIWLTMAGGPSHLETSTPSRSSPRWTASRCRRADEGTAARAAAGAEAHLLRAAIPVSRSLARTGTEICELFPHIGSVVDDICLVRSMTTDAINHDPAHMFMNTGSQIAGRPSMGAWVTYGLGSEAEDLPGFRRARPRLAKAAQNQPIAARQWSSGFLPSRFQGVQLRGEGRSGSVSQQPGRRHARSSKATMVDGGQRAQRDSTTTLVDDPEIATRIAQYEMAFQMQASVPELMDISGEGAKTLELYGCQPGDGSFASNCLLARRLAERGVRFIQLYHKDWDHHGGVQGRHPAARPRKIDRACMALITDLKQRGMLEDTLIVWAGEFGRTPMRQGGSGRDHHNAGFSIWLAGGGIKGGDRPRRDR